MTKRSDRIERVLHGELNRYEVCVLVAKGVRAMRRNDMRCEDSIDAVLKTLCDHGPHKSEIHPALP